MTNILQVMGNFNELLISIFTLLRKIITLPTPELGKMLVTCEPKMRGTPIIFEFFSITFNYLLLSPIGGWGGKERGGGLPNNLLERNY